MFRKRSVCVILVSCLFACSGVMYARNSSNLQSDQTLHIDIPTKLEKANVVVDMGHLFFNGDVPFALGGSQFSSASTLFLISKSVIGTFLYVFKFPGAAILARPACAAVDCHSPGLSPTTLVLHIDGQRPLTPIDTVKWS